VSVLILAQLTSLHLLNHMAVGRPAPLTVFVSKLATRTPNSHDKITISPSLSTRKLFQILFRHLTVSKRRSLPPPSRLFCPCSLTSLMVVKTLYEQSSSLREQCLHPSQRADDVLNEIRVYWRHWAKVESNAQHLNAWKVTAQVVSSRC